MVFKFIATAAIVSAGLSLGADAAHATPSYVDVIDKLTNVVFDDGATASGTFSLNVYGYLGAFDVVTTASANAVHQGPSFTGRTYVTGDPSSLNHPTDNILIFDVATYNGYLQLAFQMPLDPPQALIDPLLLTNLSFECSTFACTSGDHKERYIVSGSAVDVPEPASLTLLGVGLVGVGLTRRRRA